ncbi:MAG: cytochrome c [Chitinophagaceae bacterium]
MPREMTYVVKATLLLLTSYVAIVITVRAISTLFPANDCDSPSRVEPVITNKKGENLFKGNCATCHRPTKDLTGPALAGAEERVGDRPLLYAWVRNNNAILKTGNKYFSELYNKWNKTPMNLFPDITDTEIDSIMAYVNEYAEVVRLARKLPEPQVVE